MTERRPHWDEELIFAVMSAAGDGGHLFIDDIHAVIAAVEDWQRQRGPSLTEFIEMDDAIKRVRAVADAWEYYASENGNVRTAWAASSVREALDGDA